jgi:hypothetical protein
MTPSNKNYCSPKVATALYKYRLRLGAAKSQGEPIKATARLRPALN